MMFQFDVFFLVFAQDPDQLTIARPVAVGLRTKYLNSWGIGKTITAALIQESHIVILRHQHLFATQVTSWVDTV